MEQLCPCTNIFSSAYAHVRIEPSDIGQTRGKKNLNQKKKLKTNQKKTKKKLKKQKKTVFSENVTVHTREAPTVSPKSLLISGAKNEPSGHGKVLLLK